MCIHILNDVVILLNIVNYAEVRLRDTADCGTCTILGSYFFTTFSFSFLQQNVPSFGHATKRSPLNTIRVQLAI